MHSSQIGETPILESLMSQRGRPALGPSSRPDGVWSHAGDAPCWRLVYLAGRWVSVVEMLFIRVHPNFRRPNSILEEVWSCVGSLFRKNVAHMRAGMNLQAAPALPHLRGEKKQR